MAEIKTIKKGLDIQLFGEAADTVSPDDRTTLFGIVPDDFPGPIWKPDVTAGDEVKAGQPIMHAKDNTGLCLTAPVSGRIAEVRRGERRHIEAITIEHQGDDKVIFDTTLPTIELLCQSGLWAMMRQRPYDIVPRPDVKPRDIFITAFDTAPLAPAVIDHTCLDDMEAGIKALAKLTSGKVYLGVRFGSGIQSAIAETIEFRGPHPAGNVGTQIAAIRPVNKGEVVWTLDARTVARMGRLITTGELDTQTVVAITGQSAVNPEYVSTHIGASLSTLLQPYMPKPAEHLRVISGNVLTGVKEDPTTGFLRYPYRQVTLMPEGDNADEFMGWASVSPNRYSVKRSFPARLFGGLKRPFSFDARLKGGRRSMIVSGEYDRVFPFDIYPEYLIRAIEAHDIDRMEKLGIYEVAPEDFALAEFVDTSKLPLQQIVRDGLDSMRHELS